MHQSIRSENPINQISAALRNQHLVQKVEATWTGLKHGQAISTRLSSRKGIVIAVIYIGFARTARIGER